MATIQEIIRNRILVLDGAIGTMIQRHNLSEEDFRGKQFANHPIKLVGNNDILCLTQPHIISALHREYLEAGADIISTCSFNAQAISQADYGTRDYISEINLAAARLAHAEAERMTLLTPNKPRFVAGSIGPTGKTASMSPDVENPALRVVDFDMLQKAYEEQIAALIEGGVDLLLFETIFDTLNVKAALAAADSIFKQKGTSLPIMLSATIADASGRMLSGQTIEAFLCSVSHANIFSVGLNCSFGAEQMLPYLKEISQIAPWWVSAHPNAGIPDSLGCYDQTPEMMARNIGEFIEQGVVNIVGGCCGSTPDHIRAIAKVASSAHSVRQAGKGNLPQLAGIDAFRNNGAFINVGERCNVAGSRKFLRLIKEKSYDEALAIARAQVRDGAMILDLNMDDAMLDARQEMVRFLNLMASDPEIARLPFMVDSSRFEVIEAALKTIQGKAIVNSLSLKEGEEIFLERARKVRDLGAALIVMAFDEKGQATTFERKIEVCNRAYKLLTERLAFDPRDIIFDPNILTIATGIKEHDSYALDFIRATEWIHSHLPHASVSGGVSNLSFSLRGNNFLREAMHAVFLYHAIRAGMDMAIVNPSTAVMYEQIPQPLLEVLEDVILARREDATDRLLAIAENYKAQSTENQTVEIDRKTISIEERLAQALQRGEDEHLQDDIAEALSLYPSPASIIEGPLMAGMTLVGKLFAEGKMFLPQVVKTARTMKRAVEILQPYITSAQNSSAVNCGRYLLATVKGDVHDIGKNIAAVVLGCNNFEVIDLGVMVTAEDIVKTAIEKRVDYIGLSGLITPSLDEMCNVASELKKAGVSVPLFIGGATTSPLHTAVKIAPLYDGPVFHVKDAAQNPIIAMQLSGHEREKRIACLRYEQELLRQTMESKPSTELSDEKNIELRKRIDWSKEKLFAPTFKGVHTIEKISIAEVRPYINWRHFLNLWGIKDDSAEANAKNLIGETEALLDRIEQRHYMSARVGFFEAYGTTDSIVISHSDGCPCCSATDSKTTIYTPRQRSANRDGEAVALCDYIAPKPYGDHIGAFAITICRSFVEELEELKSNGEMYDSLLMQSIADRLAEAASEWLHTKVRRELWGYAPEENIDIKEMFQARYKGIRPAVGYPSLPDQRNIFPIGRLLHLEKIGISLTENGAMYPQSSVCGVYIASPHAKYFILD